MLSLMLGFPVAMSDAADWTTMRKGIAITWIAVIDVLIIAVCCM
jgi:hypothetical protein